MSSSSDENVTSIDAATQRRTIVTGEIPPTGPPNADVATRPIDR